MVRIGKNSLLRPLFRSRHLAPIRHRRQVCGAKVLLPPTRTAARQATVARHSLAQRLNWFAFQPASFTGTRACGDFVDLRRHDEIVLVQTFDLLGLKHDRGETPAEVDE